jgi:hypothetical protein
MEVAPVGVGPLTQGELPAAILDELRQRSISGFQDCGPRTYPASRCSREVVIRGDWLSVCSALLRPIPALPDSFRGIESSARTLQELPIRRAYFGMHSAGTNLHQGSALAGRPAAERLPLAADRVGPVAALRAFGASRQFPAMSDPPNIKPEARRLVDSLPDSATWDDLAYEVYVRQSVEAGLADADAGRIVTHDEALARVRARIRRAS